MFSFRPLSRQIGSCTWSASSVASPYKAFPAPFEVDKELYERVSEDMDKILDGFRPLARQIGSYTFSALTKDKVLSITFPAPREVDRQLYVIMKQNKKEDINRFRPLARQIGIYTLNVSLNLRLTTNKVSGPSRGRQVTIPLKDLQTELVKVLVSGPSRGRQGAIHI